MRRLLVLMTLGLMVSIGSVLADVVIQNDGTRHDGSIIYKDAYIVVMKTDAGKVIKIPRDDVIWITETGAKPAEAKPEGLSLEQAVARIVGDVGAALAKRGHKAVAVAPFWGPGEKCVPLDDTVGEQTARGLSKTCRVIEPGTMDKVLTALQLQRSALQGAPLCSRLATILGADAIIVGQISVAATTVTVQAALLEAENGRAIAELKVTIEKNPDVCKLIGEEPVLPVLPVLTQSVEPQSGISSRFKPQFSLRAFHQRFVSGKPDAAYEGDRVAWTLQSGNSAAVTADGKVIVTSTRKLTEQGQATKLEDDLAGVFLYLAKMVDGYTTGNLHKDVEFDSVYYAHKPGIFHRFIIRERDDVARRKWTLQKNMNEFRYGKIALIIEGSWAKLSLGPSYVVSFGRWTTRNATTTLSGGSDTLDFNIVPYGWVQWYIGTVDMVTEPTLKPPKLEGWGSRTITYRGNELIEHLNLGCSDPVPQQVQRTHAGLKKAYPQAQKQMIPRERLRDQELIRHDTPHGPRPRHWTYRRH